MYLSNLCSYFPFSHTVHLKRYSHTIPVNTCISLVWNNSKIKCCSLSSLPLNAQILLCNWETLTVHKAWLMSSNIRSHTLLALYYVTLCPLVTVKSHKQHLAHLSVCILRIYMWRARTVKCDLFNNPDQRIPSTDPWTDVSNIHTKLQVLWGRDWLVVRGVHIK